MDKALLEQQLAELPLYQYTFITTDQLTFTDRVRYVCEQECPMYNTTWACPPAVGTVEECKARVLGYPEALMISTVTEVNDIANMEETLGTRAPHEEITRDVLELVRAQCKETMALSTEACAICEHCAWPNASCRHPNRMFPCVESHGILVTALADTAGIDFLAEGNIVTWYSLILFRD